MGAFASAARTADQTAAAQFWATGPASLAWTRIALGLAETDGMNVLDHARTFALLSSVLADSQVAGFDSKYDHRFWRPVTAIRLGDLDGNALTAGDPDRASLITTPAFPGYVSTHSILSRAAALGSIYGSDNPFCLTLGAGMRCFDDVDAAALDASNSRIWGGIHFRFDTDAGLNLGQQLANYAASRDFLDAVPEPSTWATMILGFGLVGAIARRARRRRAPRRVVGLALSATIAALFTGGAAPAAVVTVSSATLASNPGSYGPLDAAGTTLNVLATPLGFDQGSLAVSTTSGFEGLRIGANDDDGFYLLVFSNPITCVSMLVNSMSTITQFNVSEVFGAFTTDAPGLTLDSTNIQFTAWDGSRATSGPSDDNGTFLMEITAAPGAPFTTVGFTHEQTGNANGSVIRQIQYEVFAEDAAVPEPATWAMMLLGFASIGGLK